MEFNGGVKGFKLWDLEDKKFVYNRDVTFNKSSMLKASSFQQVENKINEILQRVEFDATPYVPVSCTSQKKSTLKETLKVDKEVVFDDVPQQEEATIDVEHENDIIATRRQKGVIKNPGWLAKDMAVANALLVINDDILNTFNEVINSSESGQ